VLRLSLSPARFSKKPLRVIHYSSVSYFSPFLIVFLETLDILVVVVALLRQSRPGRAFLSGVCASLSSLFPVSSFPMPGFLCPGTFELVVLYSSLSYVSLVQLLRTVSAKLQLYREAACPKSGR